MNPHEREYIIGLGANLGSRQGNLEAGLELLDAVPGCRVVRASSLYETDPVGPPQPRYLNAAALIYSELAPEVLLSNLLAIETRLGRIRRERWGPRTLDLDILWARESVQSPALCIPHPRLCERVFALAPLLEVAPELAGEYGQVLAALGANDARSAPWARGPNGELQKRGDRFELIASGLDLADAVGAVLTLLGRRLAGERGCGGSEARVILGTREEEPKLAAFVAETLAHIAGGFVLSRATLCELTDAHAEGRVLGRQGSKDGPRLALLAVGHSALPDGGERVVISLTLRGAAGTEDLAFLPQILDR